MKPAQDRGTIFFQQSCRTAGAVSAESTQCSDAKDLLALPNSPIPGNKIPHHIGRVGILRGITQYDDAAFFELSKGNVAAVESNRATNVSMQCFVFPVPLKKIPTIITSPNSKSLFSTVALPLGRK